MNREERLKLIHALMEATNAFRDEFKKYGYYVSYGLDDSKVGSIYKTDIPAYKSWPLGDLTISWKLRKEDNHDKD